MPDSVAQWLEQLGLSQYAEAFAENGIDYRALPALTEDDLKELGLKLGHRRVLQQAIADLQQSREPPIDVQTGSVSPSPSDTDLAAWRRHPGERKPVTMLFADITGSTALTEKLDAEETHDLLYGAAQRMCAAIESNHGTVCRFMGDGVMAMFGAPMASEQHALEACEAALEMQEAIRDYATDGEASGLRIRVGLHSGEVVVLTVGEGDKVEYDASGPTVPIAARMEQSAKPGEIYLTRATQSLAANRIETEALAPVLVKGISEPVPVFALRRVRSVEEAAPNAARTPFVGRRAELNQFKGMLETCIEGGYGQTVYVRGEPGIGKTRLVDEFTKTATRKGASIHRGLVLPFGVGKGQDSIRSLVRSLLGIAPGGGKDERLLAAQAALSDNRLEPSQAVFLNDLLDLPQSIGQKSLYDAMDNTTRNDGQRAVVSALLSIVSKDQPTVVIIEDAHWADALTLAHLATLTQTAADCPALLVMTSRIEGDPLDQSWRSTTDGSPFVAIDLGPLRNEDSVALIGEFINTNDALAKSCLERAAGNPLFLEQLLRNAQEVTTESLPDSIQSLVLARIDRLEARDKKALQAASIIGQRFDEDVLRHLLETQDYDCHELARHNLVRPIAGGFLFTHALIQESVYSSLIKGQRRELHGKAARWFADSDRILHAEHLAHAGDEGAAEAFLVAAHEQAEQYRLERALALAERGLELSADKGHFPLQCLHGELLRSLGSSKESIAIYRVAKETATSEIDRCRASIGIAEGLRITAQHDELKEILIEIEDSAKKYDLDAELARIFQLRGNLLFQQGRPGACMEASEQALVYSRRANSPALEAQTLSNLGDAEYGRGRMISAHRYYLQCVELSQEHHLFRSLAANLGMVAATAMFSNDFQALRDNYHAGIELAKNIGQLTTKMNYLGTFAYYGADVFDTRELLEAEAQAEEAMGLAHRIGNPIHKGFTLIALARVRLRQGHRRRAAELASQSVELFCSLNSSWEQYANGTLAEATDNADERKQALKRGERIPDSTVLNSIQFYRDAAAACLNNKDWSEAERFAQALEECTRAEPLPMTAFLIARARALALFGKGRRDAAVLEELQRLHDEAQAIGFVSVIPALSEALASL